jgi:hypothetical protein
LLAGGVEGELGDVLFFGLDWPVPAVPDELLEPLLAPVPPVVSAGRSQPVRSAPESANARARVSVRVMWWAPFGT